MAKIQKVQVGNYTLEVGKTFKNRYVEYPVDYCINDLLQRIEYLEDLCQVNPEKTGAKILGALFCANVLLLNFENNLDKSYDIVNKEILIDLVKSIIMHLSKVLDFKRGNIDGVSSTYFVDKRELENLSVLMQDLCQLIKYKQGEG